MKSEASRRHREVSIASPTDDAAAMAGLALHQSGTAGSPGGNRRRKDHGLATLATWAGVATAMIGGGHLVAWLTGWITERGATDITMKTNAALCLLLSGVALVLLVPPEAHALRRRAGRICAALALLIGALTLSEHVIGWDLGIDQLLAREPPGAMGVLSPNRMGPPAATSVTLAGVALLLLSRRDRRGLRWAQGLALAVCLIALLSGMGHLYGARTLWGVADLMGIAWPTVVALLVLGVGILCVWPGGGLMAQVTADDAGGLTIRRLLIPMLVLMVAIGWLRLAGERLDFYDAAQGTALVTLVAIILFGAMIYHNGRRLSRSAAALRQSEEVLRTRMAAIDAAADIVVITDPNGTIQYVNPVFTAITGYSPEEAIGQNPRLLKSGIQGADFYREMWQTILAGRTWHGEVTNRRKDGTHYHEEMSITPVSGEDGRIITFVAIKRDVTERKRAEGALAESRQRLAGVVDSAMDAILTVDEQQRIVLFNPAAERMFRCPADQALGSPVERFIPQRFRVAHRGHIQRFGQTGQTSRTMGHLGAISGLRLDGEEFPIEASISQVQVGGHNLFTVILRDITERKRAEEVLRQSEEKFRALAENAHASAGIIQGTRFVYVNSNLAEVSGYTVPELLSMEFAQVVHPDFRPMMMERARRRQMGEPMPSHYEFMLLTKSGDARWLDFSVGTILYEGKPAIIGSGFDITEHKRAVEAVRESRQQLQEVNLHLEQRIAERTAEAEYRAEQLRELASELTRAEQHERSRVAGILHDHLQQLLVGAKFGTSVLRGQLVEESQRQALQKVDDLLIESLGVSRDLTTELSPPILREGTLAASLHWLASWMRDKHGLAVHLKTDETLNPQDEGVRILLFESVRELLFNIVKHAGTDSACATLERCDGEHLRIIVADAGPGFDPAQHRRHDRSSGGFGLFSIRERLGLIGGRFEIDSAPGQGAQMTLVAPLRLPSAEPVAPALTGLPPAAEQVAAALLEAPVRRPTVPGECARIRVLVADDHAVVRDGLAQLLQMHADVDVVGLAGDGQQAIELASSLRPDVILMDVSMPRLSGIEATRRVRSELPHVRVIGLSMHAEDEMGGRMREVGAAAYLTKTAPPDAVLQAIRGCMGTAGTTEHL